MQGVALDPLAAVEEPAQAAKRLVRRRSRARLEGMDGAHLVGDGADAADPRGDIGDLGELAAAQQGLEETRRLEDVQLDVVDPAVADADVESTFAFDPRQGPVRIVRVCVLGPAQRSLSARYGSPRRR